MKTKIIFGLMILVCSGQYKANIWGDVTSTVHKVSDATHVTDVVDHVKKTIEHQGERGVAGLTNILAGNDDSSGINLHQGALTPEQEQQAILEELKFQEARVVKADEANKIQDSLGAIQESKDGLYGDGPIKVKSLRPVKVSYDAQGHPIIYQPYVHNPLLILKYILDQDATINSVAQFPKDFLLELPKYHMAFNPKKHFNEIVVLGAHDCQSNLAQGFLYYQQGESTLNQIARGGARMIRPNWRYPSGAYMDRPNQEPILCHAPTPADCKTVSLATRGFRPHQLVQSETSMVTDYLKSNPHEILIIGISNALTDKATDEEIAKIPGLAKMVLTPADLDSKVNQNEWGAPWPTIEWMIKHNKRLFILNDNGKSQYTFDYGKFVRMNMYGTLVLAKSATARYDNWDELNNTVPYALAELSWFGNISPDPYLMDMINIGVEFYRKMRSITFGLKKGFGGILSIPLKILNEIGLHADFFDQPISFASIEEGMTKMLSNQGVVKAFPPFADVVNSIDGKVDGFKKAVDQIKEYIPVKQDNSIPTLMKLVQLSRKNGVIRPDQIVNNMMLDFATTQGNGIEFVNMMNVLMDQYLELDFVGLGGFALNGQKINLIDGLLPQKKANYKKMLAELRVQEAQKQREKEDAKNKKAFDAHVASLYQQKEPKEQEDAVPIFSNNDNASTSSFASLYGN